MSNHMDHKKLQGMAEELAKDLKTPENLSQLSAFLTKLTVETALEGGMSHHIATIKTPLKVITLAIVAMVLPQKF